MTHIRYPVSKRWPQSTRDYLALTAATLCFNGSVYLIILDSRKDPSGITAG